MNETAADRARRERLAQGLTPKVTNKAALARLAVAVRTAQLRTPPATTNEQVAA